MPDARDIRGHLESRVRDAVAAACAAGELPDMAVTGSLIERPKDTANGDFATTLPLRLARAAMKPPLEIANVIARHLPADDTIDTPRVAPPGFINFRLSTSFVQHQVERIIELGPAYADLALGAGRKAQVEFVSANPTGPLTVGHGRNAGPRHRLGGDRPGAFVPCRVAAQGLRGGRHWPEGR